MEANSPITFTCKDHQGESITYISTVSTQKKQLYCAKCLQENKSIDQSSLKTVQEYIKYVSNFYAEKKKTSGTSKVPDDVTKVLT